MTRKSNSFEFIEKAKLVHGNKYDYSLVEYIGTKLPVKLICKIHGIFEQQANSHLCGRGCMKCGGKYQYNSNEFIIKAKLKHGNIYDYSRVYYINNQTKILIICPIHGEFMQTPSNHLHGYGCIKCSGRYKYTTDEFIRKANLKHSNIYDYSKAIYFHGKTNVNIGCPFHGFFKIKGSVHLNGGRCPKCVEKQIMTTNEFIEKANLIHCNRYDYSLVNYSFRKIKIEIQCKKHGIFKQSPHNHLHGAGCPKCKLSKGEIIIENFLIENNIDYFSQKKFKDCKGVKFELKFDFYIPKYNFIIEFDGRQHFEVVKFNGMTYENALKSHLELIKNDEIKDKYCINNKIIMHRIKYVIKDIKEHLKGIFEIK